MAENCPNDCIGWNEQQLEASSHWRYHAARASAGEDLASEFLDMASAAFRLGDDQSAKQQREAAEFCKRWAKNERELQQRTQKQYQADWEPTDG